MKTNKTKEWLQRGWRLDQEVQALEEAKAKALDRCLSVTAKIQETPAGYSGDSDAKLIAYADFSAQIDKRVQDLVHIKREILQRLDQIDDPAMRQVMILRYLNFNTFEEIAVKMSYSYRHICRLHGLALEKLKKEKMS